MNRRPERVAPRGTPWSRSSREWKSRRAPRAATISSVVPAGSHIVAVRAYTTAELALRGVRYRPAPAQTLLTRNLLIYGVGGLFVPFVGIKAIDVLLAVLGLA